MFTPTPTVTLTADDLLAGSALIFDVVVPPQLLRPTEAGDRPAADPLVVQLRPLTIGTLQLIMRASRQDPGLIPLLMIKESLVTPTLSLDQVRAMPLGLVNFFIAQIRHLSGLEEKKT
nr:hypothetical protein [Nodosilinea sp. TSF1-S3]